MITRQEAPTEAFEDGKCGKCTALCCNYYALEIDAPDEPEDFENLRWYIIHEDSELFIDGDDWYLQINRKCQWLDGNRCGNYENRPTICAEYSNEECDYDGIEADETFRTIEELEAYRDEWVADYEKRQKKRKAAARKSWQTRREKALTKAEKAAKALAEAQAEGTKKKAKKKASRKLSKAKKKVAKAEKRLASLG